jgi:hypothetical protein
LTHASPGSVPALSRKNPRCLDVLPAALITRPLIERAKQQLLRVVVVDDAGARRWASIT